MATKKKTEQTVLAKEENLEEQAVQVQVQAQAAANTQAEELESLSALASRYRVPSWQQAALCRFMGWAEGKMLTDAEYSAALDKLSARGLCGGRVK